jgi:3-phenylpropionate/trans-cinnamate dioxygenase ferredoxin reductase component
MTGRIVLVGGGLAAQRCAETLRTLGFDGPLTIVGAEPHAPYDRPPLSKSVLAGERDVATTALRPAGWHAEHDVDLVLGDPAVALDPAGRWVRLGSGRALRYERVLIATGAAPRALPAARSGHVLRTREDAERLRCALRGGARLVVLGAGLVGLEAASTARALGAQVTVVEAAPAPLGRALAPALGRWLAALHRAHGVDVRCGRRAVEITPREVVLDDGARLGCDALLVAIGVDPDTAWLEGSGLPAHGGVPIDGGGRTAIPGVWAAGDAARPHGHPPGQHWEAAVRQGSAAARSMLGLPVPAAPVSSWWSDQHGHRLQGLGDPALADAVRIEGDPRDGDGFSVLCLRRGRPVAALAVDQPRALPALRRALAGPEPPTQEAA